MLSPNASNRRGILRAPTEKGFILQESTEKPVARDSKQNDAASSSQVWQQDAETDESTRRLVALMAENSESIDGNDTVWPPNLHLSAAHVSHLEKVFCDNNSNANQKTKWKTST